MTSDLVSTDPLGLSKTCFIELMYSIQKCPLSDRYLLRKLRMEKTKKRKKHNLQDYQCSKGKMNINLNYYLLPSTGDKLPKLTPITHINCDS